MPEQAAVGRATIRDVADRAGVAMSSVSRVLTGHRDVSAQMRSRVEAAAKELGYEPDCNAQALRTGLTQTVGFVLRDISNPLFAEVARQCEAELRAHGYEMLITSSDGDQDTEVRNLRLLKRRRVDAIICSLVSENSAETRQSLSTSGIPVVLLDREIAGAAFGEVLCDHYTGVRDATDDLLSRGHRRIGIVGGSPAVRSSRERLRGFADAHRHAALELDESLVKMGSFDADFAAVSVHQMLSVGERPTALLTGGIASTAGALRALGERRLAVGTDIGLIVLDEWPLFEVLSPGIASVGRDPGEMGAAAARLAIEMISGEPPRRQNVPTRFVTRSSVGSPRASSGIQ